MEKADLEIQAKLWHCWCFSLTFYSVKYFLKNAAGTCFLSNSQWLKSFFTSQVKVLFLVRHSSLKCEFSKYKYWNFNTSFYLLFLYFYHITSEQSNSIFLNAPMQKLQKLLLHHLPRASVGKCILEIFGLFDISTCFYWFYFCHFLSIFIFFKFSWFK